jgi:cobalt-zinc-cadmium efflux system protein
VGGVERVHDLRVWAVGSDQPAFACHVTLAAAVRSAQEVLCQLHDVLAASGIDHCTIQIETGAEVHVEPPW